MSLASQISAVVTAIGTEIKNKQPLDADLTAIAALSTQPYGRSLLTAADAAGGRSLLGASPTSHTHVATTDLTATGTKDTTTYLRGDNTWAVPPSGAGGTGGVGRVGEIAMWGTGSVPTDWLLCDGRAVPRATYPDLFNAIGTTYNIVGDGTASTDFRLPNMQNRFPIGAGTAALASVGGTTAHVHQAPDHYHDIQHAHALGVPNDLRANIPGGGGASAGSAVHSHAQTSQSPNNSNWASQQMGGYQNTGAPDNGNPPYLAINYIIRYQATAIAPGTVMVQEENGAVAAADIINFIGSGVTATDAGGGKVNVTVTGGSGLPVLAPVRASTTFFNITQSGLQTIDGVALNVNDRVLCRGQSTNSQNGIWLAQTGAWTRAPDADTAAKIARGTQVAVLEGNADRGKVFTQLMVVTTLGTDANHWRVFTTVDAGGSLAYPPGFVDGGLYWDKNAKALGGWNGSIWQRLNGTIICTSTTRPVFTGDDAVIFETDTGNAYILSGGNWVSFGTVIVEDENGLLPGQANPFVAGKLDFQGAGVTVTTVNPGEAIVTIPGGGGAGTDEVSIGATAPASSLELWYDTSAVVGSGSDMTDTGWVDLTNTLGAGIVQYRCKAGWVIVRLSNSGASTNSGQWYTVVAAGAIPAMYRPSKTARGACDFTGSPGTMIVQPDGSVLIYQVSGGVRTTIDGELTYPLDSLGSGGVPPLDTGWINLTLVNSWVVNSGRTCGYRRIGNRVNLRGTTSGGTSGTTAFTMPAGYRPSQFSSFVCASSAPTTPSALNMGTDGASTIYLGGVTAALDQIEYIADL